MVKSKSLVMLAIALSTYQLSYAVTPGLEVDYNQIVKLSPIELSWELERLHQNFEDIQNYPEISLRSYGDTLIEILEVTKRVPDQLRAKVRELLKIKKESTGIAQLRASHPLVNEILLDLVNATLKYIDENSDEISKYISNAEIVTVKRELCGYRRGLERATKQGNFKGITDLIEDIQNLASKMEPIWLNVVKNHGDVMHQFAAKRSARGKQLHILKLIEIYNYRINRNKVQ